jgi:HSP20 family molecular chaperone IbpA
MEISYGSFAKVVYIRMAYDRDGIAAHLADGYLKLTIPRAREPEIKKIAVEIEL